MCIRDSMKRENHDEDLLDSRKRLSLGYPWDAELLPLPRIESSRVPAEALSNLLDTFGPSSAESNVGSIGTSLIPQLSRATDAAKSSESGRVRGVRQYGWILGGKQLRLPNGNVIGRPDEPGDLALRVGEQVFATASVGPHDRVFLGVRRAERGRGAMIAMEGGVLDPATTTGGSAAAAEYAPGDAVVHDGETLYIVEDVLGEGAFGAVYKARPAGGGGRALAVKSVKPSLPAEKKAKMHVQLAAEAAICFAIGRHAHLVSVHRVLPTPKGLLIVMDLVYGTDLREHAGKTFKGVLYLGGRAEANKRVDYLVAQLYLGLAHLHDRAVLHMDLKPDNLLVDGTRS